MKLITLNTWGGVVKEPLLEFLKKNSDVDIFCLQEIFHNLPEENKLDMFSKADSKLFSDIEVALQSHVGYFRPSVGDSYGHAIFIRKGITVKEEGDIIIHGHEGADVFSGGEGHSRNLQYVNIELLNDQKLAIANVHGLWNGQGKTDTPERLEQSRKIKDFMDSVNDPKILCGDFNLLPDTESLKIIEGGSRNLIREYSVTSTRTSFYTKPDKFADYVFVSPEINVLDFKVLPDEVSDHSVLRLEFEVK